MSTVTAGPSIAVNARSAAAITALTATGTTAAATAATANISITAGVPVRVIERSAHAARPG